MLLCQRLSRLLAWPSSSGLSPARRVVFLGGGGGGGGRAFSLCSAVLSLGVWQHLCQHLGCACRLHIADYRCQCELAVENFPVCSILSLDLLLATERGNLRRLLSRRRVTEREREREGTITVAERERHCALLFFFSFPSLDRLSFDSTAAAALAGYFFFFFTFFLFPLLNSS